MKICPNCRQTYADDGLNFCLSDGSPLNPLTDDATPTVYMDPPRVTNQTQWDQPPSYEPPAVWQSQQSPATQPFDNQLRMQGQDRTLPTISLVLGILGILTVCCYGGFPLGTAAIVTGVIAINHEKSDPVKYGGRSMAMGGIITGAISLAIAIGFIMIAIIA